MRKYLIVLAILSTTSVPALGQNAAASSAQPAKPQMVKKRVCTVTEEDSYSRLGNRKICKTIEVPATPTTGQQTPKVPQNSQIPQANNQGQ